MCSLGIEPTTFALLTQCSTTEPQEHLLHPGYYFTLIVKYTITIAHRLGYGFKQTHNRENWTLVAYFSKKPDLFCLLDDKMCKNIPGGTVKNQNRALSTFTNEKSS